MRRISVLAVVLATVSFIAVADNYKEDSHFGKGLKGQGKDVMQSFDPSTAVEGYTRNPPETGYYPGVTGSEGNMHGKGGEALVSSESGQTVTGSMVNNPTESISMDAPFLQTGKTAQENAEGIVSGTGDICETSVMSHIRFETFSCNRDINVEEHCSRTSTITGAWKDTSVSKTVVIPPTSFWYSSSGNTLFFSFTAPEAGVVNSATLRFVYTDILIAYTFSLFGSSFGDRWQQWDYTVGLNAAGTWLNQGQTVSGSLAFANKYGPQSFYPVLSSGRGGSGITLTLNMTVPGRVWEPRVEWAESCPFDKAEGRFVKSDCTEPGSTKTVYVDGQAYQVYQSCWTYQDTYVTQSGNEGSCSEFVANPACTLSSRQCDAYADPEDGGFCVNEVASYTCEKVTQAEGMLCGDDFYCTDGSCEETKQGQDSGFKHAVSQLAAVAAVGDDVAELNDINIKAFSGKAQTCRKTAVGFSDCCKDSGWGHDIGLDSCNSEEKALGEAKSRKLTVDVGQYCSQKVLGVCVTKKRAYCVFDSKLAQIVQQQGRKWQLGIGFGKAKSPDCRGVTIDELQAINFDLLDFRNFYSDLNDGLDIPDDNELMQRVNEQIKNELSNKGGQ